ncbi:hypothetical protein C5E07_04695 [Pseudoclavibacter sp. RFBJ3]|uniref:LmeA family phospholipid-binding protein n=1 Tax=unclassified Pseudoclavibacter TaxID=2615177 RepID=UPI000CE73F9A|nr:MULTISPECIES: DUF2993 domain-containing protein [unclassified Pseudoclavibacter]PPF84811.1 hypothetical protein C5C12_05400 [Pseudoclavibacter sp. RFBJ5]PPF93814.1 hypothetical protein C5E07_04695 [Pseudoclavibacter sp. RFBJ3]PPF98532.1 hypothetical protein C5C19_07680 [Pseudoclavibacter sp. RFBH5]PPG24509.1 hypothetical protein C5E13_07190 [Pseudoclavibacter sp. RFBI4]
MTALGPPEERIQLLRTSRARSWVKASLWLLGALLLLVGLDVGVRLVAQDRIAQQVQDTLPPGVDGEVSAHVHGFSTLWQLATGRASHVTVSADELTAYGLNLAATVDAYGVHIFDGMRTEMLTGTLNVPEATLEGVAALPGTDASLELGDDELSYRSTVSILGLTGTLTVDAQLRLVDGEVIIDPTDVEVSGTAFGQALTQALPDIAEFAVPICTADYLPAGLHVSELRIAEGMLTVGVEARNIALSAEIPDSGEFSTCRD